MLYGTALRCTRFPPFTERQPGVRQMHIFGDCCVRHRDLGRLPDLGPDQDDIVACLRSGGLGCPISTPKLREAVRSGHKISRIAVAFEAGRDGFWLARWLKARGIEAHVIHASSVAVSREHRRAKTDRLDTELLKRAFVGWLRGERDHCKTAGIPTLREEDAKRPSRERESLVGEQSRLVNRMKATLIRLGIRGFNPIRCRCARLHHGPGRCGPPNTRLRHECSCATSELPSTSSSRPQRACCRARGRQGMAWHRRSVTRYLSDGQP
jgi:hypothetical protein